MADIRRTPFKEKFIKDLGFSDFKVSVCGNVMQIREGGFILGDGTGEVYVNTSSMESKKEVNEGKVVRAMARLVPYESGFELQAEIIQNMEGLDLGAFKKVKEAFL